MSDLKCAATEEETKNEAVARLAKLGPIEFDQVKQVEAEALGCTIGALTKEVKAAASPGTKQGRALKLPEPEPWDEPVDGDALLDGLRVNLERYIVLPPYAAVVIALWVIHTFAIEVAYHTPRLLFASPEMRCGKTTALNVLRRLVARPLLAANISAAAVFRTVEAAQPTLLVDEADTFLLRHDELRGVINSGHEKHGAVVKVDGDDNEPRVFATFAATAIAAIGHMPGTIEDRSIIVHMKRRKPSEQVERLRGDRAPELDDLARMAARWVADGLAILKEADVDPPAALSDRAADGWRPLLCIADLAGGNWPELAHQAAVALSASSETDEESIRIMLLKDISVIFNERGGEKIQSETIVSDLKEMEERPWNEYGRTRKPITKTKLASLLKPFAIAPSDIRTEVGSRKGYRLEQFKDAFERYLHPDTSPNQTATCDKPKQTAGTGLFQTATPDADVALRNPPRPTETLARSVVAVQTPPAGDAHTYQPDEEDLEVEREERAAIENEPDPFDIPIPQAFVRRRSAIASEST